MSLDGRPPVQVRASAGSDGWEGFLQVYKPLLTELAVQHPEFTLALRKLERDTRLQYEHQNAQVLATLRLKDKRISELQKVVSEQREQLDVLLDELERRATTRDVETQVTTELKDEPKKVGTAVISVQTEQTEVLKEDAETQTKQDEDSGVILALEKLEMELKRLEERNLALERELQHRLAKSEVEENNEDAQDRVEEHERLEACLEILQRGVNVMNMSCSCADNPLVLFTGLPGLETSQDRKTHLSTCVNLEHHLEAQVIRLEHAQECSYLWRESAVQFMKRQNSSDCDPEQRMSSTSPQLLAPHDETEASLHCAEALRGALAQIRQHLSHRRSIAPNNRGGQQRILQELAKMLGKSKGGKKAAAKMVQEWARWEVSHLEEVRALRQGFAEERAVALSRRSALLKQIDQLEQRQLDLQAEVSVLSKQLKEQSDKGDTLLPGALLFDKPSASAGAGKHCEVLAYPHLMLKFATAEQNLLAKDEQMKVANDTIRALSCTTSAVSMRTRDASVACSGDPVDSVRRLTMELQRGSQQKIEFFRRREKDLVNIGQYFQMEKSCLQMQARLEAEQKRSAMLEAERSVCERERDALLMKVEKLETEMMLASSTKKSAVPFDSTASQCKDMEEPVEGLSDLLYFAVKRQRLLEETQNELRRHLRCSLQQLVLMKQQRQGDKQQKIEEKMNLHTSVFDCVEEHHRKCVGDFNELIKLLVQEDSTQTMLNKSHQNDDSAKQQRNEWEVFLYHYEALWIAFQYIYSLLKEVNTSFDSPVLPHDGLDFELLRRDEKILLLQQMLMNKDDQLRGGQFSTTCADKHPESVLPPMYLEKLPFQCSRVGKRLNESVNNTEYESPFLALKKLPGCAQTVDVGVQVTEVDTALMVDVEPVDTTKIELEKCLAKCAELTAQNAKLSRRLRAEKESLKCLKEQQKKLQTWLSESTNTNSKLQDNMTLAQEQIASSTPRQNFVLDGRNLETVVLVDQGSDARAKSNGTDDIPRLYVSQQEHEDLREQLSSREQENLALVQSLCSIKEKCAQMEATHQKELRVRAAEHSDSMESYMAKVNETLSRIESDKHCLEEECAQLRSKLQKLDEDSARLEVEQAQRSSKGTNTDPEDLSKETIAHLHDIESLEARVQDLELQLARERKLTEAEKRTQQLENQQEERQESNLKLKAAKAQEQFDMHCEALQEWKSKLQLEFTEYQAVQWAAQQESDRRVAFLSACVEEFVRLSNAVPSTGGKNISTKELYDVVIALARDPPRSKSKTQSKAKVLASRERKETNTNQQLNATKRDEAWVEVSIHDSREQNELEKSETMWWKLRAATMESYARAATQRNETFEDTIQRLELRMNDVKDELSMRLARESQLVSKMAALKTELATTKEQAASLAEKYQQASTELEKREGEASTRGDETQRTRMAMQRKTELLSQQKAKVASLQQELEQATKKVERLATVEKQAALLQQKAKEHKQQILHARQVFERCRDDNAQLSFHVEKAKERHAGVLARLKAARAENAQLRVQYTELKKTDTHVETDKNDNSRGNQERGINAASVASLAEESRALKRRVLQKQDVIVSYKAKLTELDAQLERQRETMVKLARTNRDLQQGQRQRQMQEQENASFYQAKVETQLKVRQGQLDGLRASVYDSFEAFVHCRGAGASKSAPSPSSSLTNILDSPELSDEAYHDGDNLLAIRRWTDFSSDDLEELKLDRGSQRAQHKRDRAVENSRKNAKKQRNAVVALRDVEAALETNPEDCRAEICELLQCLCS